MKHLIILFAFVIFSVPIVNSQELVEENENGQLYGEKSWYEIDGIKIRTGVIYNLTTFFWEDKYNPIIEVNPVFSHMEEKYVSPIGITFHETLMGPMSYRGAVFEYQNETELKDLAPAGSEVRLTTKQFRQTKELRSSLYKDFFNASDKTFADANPNWALSADVTSSRVFLGYFWGVFIPAFEYHRFMKVGLGASFYYTELSYKLNLCSQYKVTPNAYGSGREHEGKCVGKEEIDFAEANWFGISSFFTLTLWERVTKDSVWKIFNGSMARSDLDIGRTQAILKLNNHDRNLNIEITSGTLEFVSYTYRF